MNSETSLLPVKSSSLQLLHSYSLKQANNTRSSRLIISTPATNPKTLYSCIKKCDQTLYKIRFTLQNQSTYLHLSSASASTTVKVPESLSTLSYSKIIQYLNLSSSTPYFNVTPWEMLEKRYKTINNLTVPIEFSFNSSLKKLKVELPNTSKEFQIKSSGILEIKEKVEEVYDRVKLKGHLFIIDEVKTGVIAEALKEIQGNIYIIRVARERSPGLIEGHAAYVGGDNVRVEAIDSLNNVLTMIYTIDEICEIFKLSKEEINCKGQDIVNRVSVKGKRKIIIEKKHSECLSIYQVYSAGKRIKMKFIVSIYQIIEKPQKLLITAELEQNYLQKHFMIVDFDSDKPSEEIFQEFMQKVTIRKNRLQFIVRNEDTFYDSAVVIQNFFRRRLARERYLLMKKRRSKGKILYISCKTFGLFGIKAIIREVEKNLILETSGDFNVVMQLPEALTSILEDFTLIIKSIYVRNGSLSINANLLTLYQKNSRFVLPNELINYKKIFEKWKLINQEYTKISIYESLENLAIMVDMKYKIMTRQEVIDIYHELSYECIYEEITLLNNEIYLDSTIRPMPVLVLSRKFIYENSFISVIIRDHIGQDLTKQKALVFDLTLSTSHTRLTVDLETASDKTGIPPTFLIPISNYLIFNAMKIENDSISLNLNITPYNLDYKINCIQKLYRGYIVRKNIGKIKIKGNNYLAAVQKRCISGTDMMLFAYIQYGKIRIEALDKEYRLVLYLDLSVIDVTSEHRKKMIEQVVFENLYIDRSGSMKRLCVDTNIFIKKNLIKKQENTLEKQSIICLQKMKFDDGEYIVEIRKITAGLLVTAKNNDKEYKMELPIEIPEYTGKEEINKITGKIISKLSISNKTFKFKKNLPI